MEKRKKNSSNTYHRIRNVQRRYAGTSTGHWLVIDGIRAGHDAQRIGAFCSVHVFQHRRRRRGFLFDRGLSLGLSTTPARSKSIEKE